MKDVAVFQAATKEEADSSLPAGSESHAGPIARELESRTTLGKPRELNPRRTAAPAGASGASSGT